MSEESRCRTAMYLDRCMYTQGDGWIRQPQLSSGMLNYTCMIYTSMQALAVSTIRHSVVCCIQFQVHVKEFRQNPAPVSTVNLQRPSWVFPKESCGNAGVVCEFRVRKDDPWSTFILTSRAVSVLWVPKILPLKAI